MAKLSERDRQRFRWFVEEMIGQREHRSWSQGELARNAHVSKALIGSVETYERAPTPALATGLDTAFALPGTFARCCEAVRGSASFPEAFGEFAWYEAQAASMLVAEHAYVPGLLQTSDYAAAVLSHHFNVTADQVAERATARMARQSVLTREDPEPLELWCLIDEHVLTREIGSPDVMIGQLERLLATEGTNVTVQIIPRSTGAHPGLSGMFHVAELSDGATIVFLEDQADGRISDDPATISEMRRRWRYLSSLALSAEQSLAVIREAIEQWRMSGGKQATAEPTVVRALKSAKPAE